MATKQTKYVVGERQPKGTARQNRAWWMWILVAEQTATPGAPDWLWIVDRKRATRFAGRPEAQAFADGAMAWMKASGYAVRLRLVPASGGVAVGG